MPSLVLGVNGSSPPKCAHNQRLCSIPLVPPLPRCWSTQSCGSQAPAIRSLSCAVESRLESLTWKRLGQGASISNHEHGPRAHLTFFDAALTVHRSRMEAPTCHVALSVCFGVAAIEILQQ